MIKVYIQSLLNLLPPGMAYPRDKDSTVYKVVHALAALFSEHHNWIQGIIKEWWPHNTCTNLEAWEQSTSLPDCTMAGSDVPTRRTHVLNRLKAPWYILPFEDSAPTSGAALEALLLEFGIQANIAHPSTNHLIVTITNDNADCGYFKTGTHKAGRRLYSCNIQNIECILDRILPAECTYTTA